jgi:hypothetical protein
VKTNGGKEMRDDKEIERMTIVYTDGSMDIMVRQSNGTFSIEKRRTR